MEGRASEQRKSYAEKDTPQESAGFRSITLLKQWNQNQDLMGSKIPKPINKTHRINFYQLPSTCQCSQNIQTLLGILCYDVLLQLQERRFCGIITNVSFLLD